MRKLMIFGAQAMAVSAYEALQGLLRPVTAFCVTSLSGNPAAIDGVPVRELAELSAALTDEEKAAALVLIAVPGDIQAEVERELDAAGFVQHQRLDSARWAQLMAFYYARQGHFLPLGMYPVGAEQAHIELYQATFYRDKKLRQEYNPPVSGYPLQVGAAISPQKVHLLTDDRGENISAKNVNYSELTGLYWLWRNALPKMKPEGYAGLEHYRRVLWLSQDDARRLTLNDIDAVLPYPMIYWPDVSEHHKRYIKPVDWQALEQALQELAPDYVADLARVMSQRYFYNYNIVLARRDVLDAYCAWLFPILARIEELSVPRGSERHDRYIGYMGETLCTLYFLSNKQGFHIAHEECRFLV